MDNRSTQTKIQQHLWPIFFAAFVLILAWFVFESAPAKVYSVNNRTWGFDQLQYYPAIIQWSGLLVLLAVCIPGVNKLASRYWLSLYELLFKRGGRKQNVFLFVALIFAAVFYFLRVKYYFLGDFDLRMNQVMAKDFVFEEYLTMFGLYHLANFFSKLGIEPSVFFKLYSVCMGFFYVFLSFKISDVSAKAELHKLLTALLLLCSSMVLLFCGYVEIYATPAVMSTLFIYQSLKFAHGRCSFLWPVFSLILAILSHLICVAFVPALILLYYSVNKSMLPSIRKYSDKTIVLSCIAFAAIATLLLYAKGHPFLMPISDSERLGRITLFSFSHFWELLNGIILSTGPSLFVILIVLFTALNNKVILSTQSWFALMMAGCMLLLNFVSDLQRGSGDWDLMSFCAVPLLLSLSFIVNDYYSSEKASRNFVLVCVICFNFINAAFWLHINHTDRSIKKIERMLDGDPAVYYTARISGKIQTALLYKNNKLISEAEIISRKACNEARKEDVRPCLMVAERMIDLGKYEEARIFLEQMIEQRSDAAYEAYVFLIPYYQRIGEEGKIIKYLNIMYESFLRNPNSFVSSPNFDKKIAVNFFTGLYQAEAQGGSDSVRLKQMAQLIKELQAWEGPKK